MPTSKQNIKQKFFLPILESTTSFEYEMSNFQLQIGNKCMLCCAVLCRQLDKKERERKKTVKSATSMSKFVGRIVTQIQIMDFSIFFSFHFSLFTFTTEINQVN